MPSHNPYQYIPVDRPRIINWPKIILWGLGILILVFIIVFFIIKPLSQVSDRADDLLNQSDNRPQEIIDKFAPDSVPGCGEDFYIARTMVLGMFISLTTTAMEWYVRVYHNNS